MRIMSNIPALQSYNALSSTNRALSRSIERLSTGLRINIAADDAAGLAISEKMRSQIRGLNQAAANAQDGISMIQTAEGALSETHSILQRMRELSVQAANDTLTQEDRSYIQQEIDQLKEEVSRIASTTQFNKKKLLDGSASVLWSSDSLSTRAVVNGGLRQADQFGQKSALEGNYRIMIDAEPGQAQVQKTDIFKIKHKNVVMNAALDSNKGYSKVTIDNLPAGTYTLYDKKSGNSSAIISAVTISKFEAGAGIFGDAESLIKSLNISGEKLVFKVTSGNGVFYNGARYSAGAQITLAEKLTNSAGGPITATAISGLSPWTREAVGNIAKDAYRDFAAVSVSHRVARVSDADTFSFGGFYGLNASDLSVDVKSLGDVENMSVLLEVKNVDEATKVVTFQAQVRWMDAHGNVKTFTDPELMIGTAGVSVGYDKLGFVFTKASAIAIANIGAYDKGDKVVLNFKSTDKNATTTMTISGNLNQGWDGAWDDGKGIEAGYNVRAESLKEKDIQFQNYYMNSETGTVYESKVKVSFNKNIGAAASTDSKPRGTFEAAYAGLVARGDVKLRDLDEFWDSNGRFLLDDPKEITIYQGDGADTKLTLYATDTLDDLRRKLNDAIAFGLGQVSYATGDSDNFVSFVETASPNSDESVAGTFVIRSLIPGAAGALNFSGDEELIKAFSLNVIQPPSENSFHASVYDAHTGKIVATGQKISGNTLIGVVHPNVDIIFDPMANIKASWNSRTRRFDLLKEDGSYETVIHLADSATVFQVGANEGEDMGVDIGDMGAQALGIMNIVVTEREAAARSITIIDGAIGKVSKQRAKLGAYQNRLEHTINNLTTASTNTTAAESRIREADMAKEMMEFTKLNILSQAGNSMLAQANQLPQNVLSLLRG